MGRLAWISDIHIDQTGPEVLEAVVGWLAANRPDGFLIAGDLAGHWQEALAVLDRLSEASPTPVYFLPGNHDVWVDPDSDEDSLSIYERLGSDPRSIAGRVVDLGSGWSVTGTMGWFDFSFANAQYSREELGPMRLGRQAWQDKVRCRWSEEPEALTQRFLAEYRQGLSLVPDLQKTIAVTHVVPNRQFCIPEQYGQWKYFNAFLGSGVYGAESIDRQIPIHLFGHVHWRGQGLIGATSFRISALGYRNEWRQADPVEEIRRAIQFIDF